MNNIILQRIGNSSRFKQLVIKRRTFALVLTAIISSLYFGFIFLIAFAAGWLGTPLHEETSVTRGIVIGIGLIIVSFLLNAIYIWRANGEFEVMTDQIVNEVKG